MITNATVRTFAPEWWGQVDIFQNFYGGTHSFSTDGKKAVLGVKNHFQKALTLRDVAIKMLPNLAIDEDELNTKGYTSANNSKEFSAVIEEVFTELYSSIDCTRKIITSIYKRTRRLKDSTRKMFHSVKTDQLGSDFPNELKDAIISADWFEELLAIRDELTHSDIGNCHKNQETGAISYSHYGLKINGSPLIIEDVLKRSSELIDGVNNLLGNVFNYLNSNLEKTNINQLCGVFFGRAYMRTLPFEIPIDFNSGTCLSRNWFDNESAYKCPFATSCKAYQRAEPTPPITAYQIT
ncbi:hypothetical protein [Pseudomonas arsenicoxydans]|uniref:Uncharacterized protein n=1 Tax=Pseudomonas arsenicoxydans TaxID=702115 RepID=A0A4P6G0P1_9PSED|nr:hypothetical protein [Pseudomonas arsenicoxydans]QAY84168.1 hypothetical protein CUN61_09285 [Pseudomonas arsenicoxydans]